MRRAHRPHRVGIAGVLAAASLAVLTAVLVLAPVAGAGAETTRLPGSLGTVGQRTGPLQVPVPAGVTPSALSAVIAADRVVTGASVAILVNGREAARVPSALYTRVVAPISTADVVADGTVGVSLRYDAPPGASGCEAPPAITLRRLELEYTGVETPPTAVAGFFPGAASRVDVRLPPDSDDDLIAAALDAVAAVSARYGAETPVELSTTDTALPSTGAGQRVVALTASDEGVGTSLGTDSGVPALVLSGAGRPLAEAAAALGSPSLGLAGGAETGALAARPAPRPEGLTRTLAALTGTRTPLASAAGTYEVPWRPDDFGGPVSAMRLHLEGTHSAVPAGVSARLDVYVADTLVGSTSLGAEAGIDLDVEVPAELVRSAGTLRATISSAAAVNGPAGPTDPADPAAAGAAGVPVEPTVAGVAGVAGQCSPGLPLELALDPAASTLTATSGVGDARGFELFPQALGGRLLVALRSTGPARLEDAVDAARVISAVQRQAATPLDVDLIDADAFVDGDASGLLVGADEDDSLALGAPLTMGGTRTLEARSAFEVESDAPFAAFQALARRGRFVLLLGSWAPGGATAGPSLSHRVTRRIADEGWGALDGDVLLLDDGAPPFTLDTGTPVTAAVPVEEQTSALGWFAPAAVVLVGLLALQLGRTLRRRNEDTVEPPPVSPPVRRAARPAPHPAAGDDPLLGPFRRAAGAAGGETRSAPPAGTLDLHDPDPSDPDPDDPRPSDPDPDDRGTAP